MANAKGTCAHCGQQTSARTTRLCWSCELDRRASKRKPCAAAECERPTAGNGLCVTHRQRWRDGVMEHPEGLTLTRRCSIEDCDRPVRGRGWCSLHWQRWKKHGDPEKRVRHGLGWLNEDGYRVVYRGGRDILEHRYVMEQHLGRPLAEWENVHHRNGIRDCNDLSNLEIWVTAQPSGQRPQDLAAWVVEHYPVLVEAELRKQRRDARRGQLRLAI